MSAMHPFNRQLHRQSMKRARRFLAMHQKGMSMTQIGVKERISRQAVSKLILRLKASNGNGHA